MPRFPPLDQHPDAVGGSGGEVEAVRVPVDVVVLRRRIDANRLPTGARLHGEFGDDGGARRPAPRADLDEGGAARVEGAGVRRLLHQRRKE